MYKKNIMKIQKKNDEIIPYLYIKIKMTELIKIV